MKVRSLDKVDLAVMLGSGLGRVSDAYHATADVSFEEIPGVTRPEVVGHRGGLKRCAIGRRACLFVEGRRHHYEGKARELYHLIAFVKSRGVDKLLLTSAAGSIDPALPPGQLVLIEQIVDLQHRSPASGVSEPRPAAVAARPEVAGPRLELDGVMNDMLRRSAAVAGISLATATMATCSGPAYETPAEVRALQQTGASVVSMSGAPEIAAANSLGIQVASVALITNWATSISDARPSHANVLEAGRRATDLLTRLIAQFARFV